MFDKFIDYFDGKEFESIEEYNAEVLRFSNDIEEELGRAERWALTGERDVLKQLGVEIKEMGDDSDDSCE